jgi:putative PEP-CTERM system TPR-repeat lipoprotein
MEALCPPGRRISSSAFIWPLIFLLLISGCMQSPQARSATFLHSGQKFLEAKDFNRAILEFRNAVHANPKNAEAHYQLGLAYLESGAFQSSIEELQQTLATDPKHSGAELKLAELMAATASLEIVKQGQEKAQAILKASPNNAEALQTLAVTELRLDSRADAIRHLEEALATAPQQLGSAVTLASIKLREGDTSGAEALMEKAAASSPNSSEHFLALGYIYWKTQKPERAESAFRRAAKINPKYGRALAALGTSLFLQNKREEAGRWFQQASALPDEQYRPLYATFLFQNGETDRALVQFQKVYQAEPQNRDLRRLLVIAQIATGHKQEALAVLTKALATNQNDTDALIQRAEVNLLNEHFQDAETDTFTVLKFKPDSAIAHLFMGRVHASRNARARQIQEFAEAVRLDPRLLTARLALAHAYSTSNAVDSALQILDQASPEEKKTLDYIVERNVALYQVRDFNGLRKGIEQGLAIARHPAILLQDGSLKISVKEYAGARASLEEVLTMEPQEWRAVQGIAQSYAAEKRNAEAIAAIRKYAAASPNSAEGQNLLGTWLANSGDLQGARAAFTRAKGLAPSSIEPHLALGNMAFAENKFDEARQQFTAALNRAPENLAALQGLAVTEERAGRATAAIPYYERVLAKDSHNIQAMNNLAYLLADTGANPDRALSLAQKAKELAPNDPAIDDTIGWAYYNKSLYKFSLDYLKKAAMSGTPRRTSHLAMAYIRLGNTKQAMELVQAALSKDPNLPEAQRALTMLAQTQ